MGLLAHLCPRSRLQANEAEQLARLEVLSCVTTDVEISDVLERKPGVFRALGQDPILRQLSEEQLHGLTETTYLDNGDSSVQRVLKIPPLENSVAPLSILTPLYPLSFLQAASERYSGLGHPLREVSASLPCPACGLTQTHSS